MMLTAMSQTSLLVMALLLMMTTSQRVRACTAGRMTQATCRLWWKVRM